MLSAQAAIVRTRRDLVLGLLLKVVLVGTAVACLLVASPMIRIIVLSGVGGAWLALSFSSARGSRLVADSPTLIASGQYEEAERRLDSAMRAFSLFRGGKLQGLHYLAVLRHAQRQWQDSALLCRALLGERLGSLQGLSKPSRLILADALLEMGDLHGAHDAITGLYAQRLSLQEVLNLLLVQLEYGARAGAWPEMFQNVMTKVQLAEIMPTMAAGRAQAFLALAAQRMGRQDCADWLRARVELLVDVPKLLADRPMLQEVMKTREQE